MQRRKYLPLKGVFSPGNRFVTINAGYLSTGVFHLISSTRKNSWQNRFIHPAHCESCGGHANAGRKPAVISHIAAGYITRGIPVRKPETPHRATTQPGEVLNRLPPPAAPAPDRRALFLILLWQGRHCLSCSACSADVSNPGSRPADERLQPTPCCCPPCPAGFAGRRLFCRMGAGCGSRVSTAAVEMK